MTIDEVKIIKEYTIRVKFNNGDEKICNLEPFLEKGDFRELKDKNLFNTIRSIKWGVEWSNGLDLSADTLDILGKPVEKHIPCCEKNFTQYLTILYAYTLCKNYYCSIKLPLTKKAPLSGGFLIILKLTVSCKLRRPLIKDFLRMQNLRHLFSG
jgi:hypothetical protein